VEYPLKHCSPLVFSHSGELFAAVEDGSLSITVMCLHSGDVKCKLSGHGGPITGISWSDGDRTLCSVATDGACLFWDTYNHLRLQSMDHIDKLQQWCGVAAMPALGQATARGATGLVQVIQDGRASSQIAVPAGVNLGLALLGAGRVLVVGSAMGKLLCYPWSSTVPGKERVRQQLRTAAHSAAVMRIYPAANEALLVSAAADGTVIVWDMQVCFST
jgi:WD40 repeat protein